MEDTADTTPHQARRRRRWPLVVTGAALVLAISLLSSIIVIAGAGRVAALSGLCESCHVMTPWVETWHGSSHAKIACYSCHDAAYAWYDFPGNLFGTASMLRRSAAPDGSVATTMTPIPDATCARCHDPGREPSSRGIVIIDHVEHARRNRSCLSCHMNTTHPDLSRDQPLVRMAECFDCHGQNDYPTASRTCEACHPDFFDLEPVSHKAETWDRPDHGTTALTERDQCSMCHLGNLCVDCHGITMPHPEGWTAGEQGHADLTTANDRPVCARCHTATPDPCSTCHHTGHDPTLGPWAEEHYRVVRLSGTASCVACHETTFCHRCHEE
ncbi:MAG: cytochrome c3 family protein, partial [Actinomycetota bacterium]|nr:cytochrome c3 family protein [Actinomycetota bacterium]